MINTILFDLDGTLLPMDQEEFIKLYFKGLYIKFHETYDFDVLSKTIWKGTKAMTNNDGKLSNEDVFWNMAFKEMGLSKEENEDRFKDSITMNLRLPEAPPKPIRQSLNAFIN